MCVCPEHITTYCFPFTQCVHACVYPHGETESLQRVARGSRGHFIFWLGKLKPGQQQQLSQGRGSAGSVAVTCLASDPLSATLQVHRVARAAHPALGR